jgi:hypothetical protein
LSGYRCRYNAKQSSQFTRRKIPYSPFEYARRKSQAVCNIGGSRPGGGSGFMHEESVTGKIETSVINIEIADKWKISDA